MPADGAPRRRSRASTPRRYRGRPGLVVVRDGKATAQALCEWAIQDSNLGPLPYQERPDVGGCGPFAGIPREIGVTRHRLRAFAGRIMAAEASTKLRRLATVRIDLPDVESPVRAERRSARPAFGALFP